MSDTKSIGRLYLKDGAIVKIFSDGGRFWVCEGRMFRKNNPLIAKVELNKKADKERPEPQSAAEKVEDTAKDGFARAGAGDVADLKNGGVLESASEGVPAVDNENVLTDFCEKAGERSCR